MLNIIGTILNIIIIGLTIYELFFKKSSNSVNQYIQINLIQQINPRYNVQLNYEIEKNNNVALKNAEWKTKRIFQAIVILIYISLGINVLEYIKDNTIATITDFTAIFYIPLRNMLIYLSSILIIFCIIVIVRGWEHNKPILYNLVSMKYFSLKIIADFLMLLSLLLVSYSFLEKVNANMQNPIYPWGTMGLAIQFLLQLMWIQFTISKLTKSIQPALTYEAKEKQLFMYVPAYVFSVVLSILIVYIKFF